MSGERECCGLYSPLEVPPIAIRRLGRGLSECAGVYVRNKGRIRGGTGRYGAVRYGTVRYGRGTGKPPSASKGIKRGKKYFIYKWYVLGVLGVYFYRKKERKKEIPYKGACGGHRVRRGYTIL